MLLICFAPEGAKFCEAGLAAVGGIGRGGLDGFEEAQEGGAAFLAAFIDAGVLEDLGEDEAGLVLYDV